MKKIILATTALLNLYVFSACQNTEKRDTGNDQGARVNSTANYDSTNKQLDRPDTNVNSVSGSSNAVNSVGNAGTGSGMGASSLTEAERKQNAEKQNTEKKH